MEFRIADTFTESLAKLNGDEQKAVKTTAFDLQVNPAHPGLQFHKLERAKDPNFWSIRVSRDVRIIVHRAGTSLLLCYVGHHDDSYQWAERRKLETHPKTGAAQLVEIRERVQEIIIPKYVETEAKPRPLLFASLPDSELLGYGVPAEWLPDVRNANEETILDLADHLPKEAAEALLDLATGVIPQTARLIPSQLEGRLSFMVRETAQPGLITPQLEAAPVSAESFEHPDATRRFRLINNLEELERALDYPWEKWTIFLHPAQLEQVERDYNGPARVSGSAGTGKTIVALHRVVYLARKNPDSRLLLTTFSEPLSNALRTKLRYLIGNEPRLGERIEIHAMNSIGKQLYEANIGKPQFARSEQIRELLERAAQGTSDNRFSTQFLITEWDQVVDAWQLETWEAYRDVTRLGRRTRLKEPQRAIAWSIFEKTRSDLKAKDLITYSQMFSRLASFYVGNVSLPFDYLVVDEAQDVSIAQLRLLAALGGNRVNSLFFAGDLGQRIFQQPFSWKALGVDIRGRSTTLTINYRTSHQIRRQADRLLGPELADVDGNSEERKSTISLFNGPAPTIQTLESPETETKAVGGWLKAILNEGLLPHEIAIFVRSASELDRARAAAEAAGLPFKVLDDKVETAHGKASIATMHLAKGLEFRAVAVMACDDEVIPQQKRIETVADDSDLEEVYNTERHLLYVACTRARDHLLVTSASPASEFLDDLRAIEASR
jgi:superfamily I DNA/RNA helicase/mRNA-degrading endonuclease RelE of RelBE toxin-antitoxin system